MEKKKTEKKKTEEKKLVETGCHDKDCPIHGGLKTRGRTFKGIVISKHDKRVAIEFERLNYIRKYERYSRSKSKMHARLSRCMEKEVSIGDLIKIAECRPLSKIIHFVVVEKLKDHTEILEGKK